MTQGLAYCCCCFKTENAFPPPPCLKLRSYKATISHEKTKIEMTVKTKSLIYALQPAADGSVPG
jgi:hypothetical protein